MNDDPFGEGTGKQIHDELQDGVDGGQNYAVTFSNSLPNYCVIHFGPARNTSGSIALPSAKYLPKTYAKLPET